MAATITAKTCVELIAAGIKPTRATRMAAQQLLAPAYRVRFVHDKYARFEECNGEGRPLTASEYTQNEYLDDNRNPLSYADYLAYYGNPDRHVYLMAVVQQRSVCGEWETVGGTSNIDFMDDSPELTAVDRWFDTDAIDTLPGYLRLIALEDLTEAGWPAPKGFYCAARNCRYFHEANSRFCAAHKTKVVAERRAR